MKSATIYDVARRAGVSHQTVTRFLNGFEGIRPSTRERVQRAVVDLDYRPNAAARMLRTQRINRLGFLADRMDESGPSRTILGATKAARAAGYVLDIVGIDGGDASSVSDALDVVMQDQVAGIIISVQTVAAREALNARTLTIPVARDFDLVIESSGETINRSAGAAAGEHLAQLGHTKVAHLAGPSAWTASTERYQGLQASLRTYGGDVVVVEEGDWSAASGFDATNRILASGIPFTAIAAANDTMALGALAALAAAGLNVPADISVIATDNSPEAPFMAPALTSVALDFASEGQYVVSTLVAEIEGTTYGERLLLPAPFVVSRMSTASLG